MTENNKRPSDKELRKIIIKTIEAGEATEALLLQATGLPDKKALSRIFSQLKIMEKHVVEADGKFTILNEDEFVAHAAKEKERKAAEKAAAKPPKKAKPPVSPELVRRRAVLAYNSRVEALQKARVEYGKNPKDIILGLKAQVAQLQFTIADLQLKKVKMDLAKSMDLEVADIDAVENLDEIRA